jgi:hypothetical protein
MVAGLGGALAQYILYRIGVFHYASALAADVWTALWGFAAGIIAILLVTFFTPAPDTAKVAGLVYIPSSDRSSAAWYRTPEFYAVIVAVIFAALNIIFF